MKKVLFIIAVIVGIGVSYFVGYTFGEKSNQKFAGVGPKGFTIIKTVNERIPTTLALTLMKQFEKENGDINNPSPWRTIHGKNLRGFFVARPDLDAILKTEGAAGISVYLAKHHTQQGSSKPLYSIIYRGTKYVDSTRKDGEIIDFGDFYNFVEQCPERCGTN